MLLLAIVSEEYVDELASVLNDVADQWFNFTGLLGIPFDVRERIRLDHSSDPQLCLKMALRIWILVGPNRTYDKVFQIFFREAEASRALAEGVKQYGTTHAIGNIH